MGLDRRQYLASAGGGAILGAVSYGLVFGDDSTDYIRISYLQPLERIKVAMDRIASFTKAARAAA